MSGGVGVLGAECGAEGVDGSESCGTELAFKLTAYGEGGGFAEEVGREVNLSVLGLGEVVEVERSHLEHGSGAFAVRGRDEGSVEVEESALLEEAVDCEGQGASHAEHRTESVGAGTQVGFLAEEFQRVAFFLQGIGEGIG